MLTTRDIEVLKSVARYYVMTRGQINRLHFPTDVDGRITRKRLGLLHDAHLLNRAATQITNVTNGAPAYIYYPSADGCAFLAQELQEPSYKHVCTLTPNWMYLHHWVDVTETHMVLDKSISAFPVAALEGWMSEWDVANKDEKEPEKRYRLYTKLGPKLVCAPDAAFLLHREGYKKVFYLEEDRDTTKNADRVAAQKCYGYSVLYEERLHMRKHFPNANVEKFAVLFVTPSARRRDALRLAFNTRPAAGLYRFAAKPDLTPESFLRLPVWYPCLGDPLPLLKGGEG